MKIAVGLIVYNGMPYIRAWLQHYLNCPDIDYVVIAEGATQNMGDALKLTTPASNDGTISEIHKYITNPKLQVVFTTRFYPEKLEQTNHYINLLPPDTTHVWVADYDEFYSYADINYMRRKLTEHGFTYVSVQMYHFWKNYHTIGVGPDNSHEWGYNTRIDRIFRYHPGMKFTNHRPMTMPAPDGRNVKHIKPFNPTLNECACWHYSYVNEKCVNEKMQYYEKAFNRTYMHWYHNVWKPWTPINRHIIESRYSIHPTVAGAKTEISETLKNNPGLHPVDITQFD